ncbi:hypothetical protein [Sphingomonas oryzagri]
MSDREGDIAVPPPAYMFAPYYIDQDSGWNRPWASFQDLYLPETARTLADYHSGIRPDAYYTAKAKLAVDRLALSEADAGISALRDAITQIQHIDDGASPTYDLGEFRSEVDDLVRESEGLLNQQRSFRRDIANLHEESHLVRTEKMLLESAVRELREEFDTAVSLPDEVECPTCGQGYTNNLSDRFALIQDEGVLTEAIGVAAAKLASLANREGELIGNLREIDKNLSRIERILAVERATLTFNDVVVGAGKTEAAKILRSSLNEKAGVADDIRARVKGHKDEMAAFTSAQRTSEIMKFYRARLVQNAIELDVTLENDRPQPIHAIQAARGSEGPRGLIAYFYAFLQTHANFVGTSSFPIVIDAPNQQGQDAVHLPAILKFIFEKSPGGNQVIVAAEEPGDTLPDNVDVRSFGVRRRQVLRESEFDEVQERFSHYTRQMIAE